MVALQIVVDAKTKTSEIDGCFLAVRLFMAAEKHLDILEKEFDEFRLVIDEFRWRDAADFLLSFEIERERNDSGLYAARQLHRSDPKSEVTLVVSVRFIKFAAIAVQMDLVSRSPPNEASAPRAKLPVRDTHREGGRGFLIRSFVEGSDDGVDVHQRTERLERLLVSWRRNTQ